MTDIRSASGILSSRFQFQLQMPGQTEYRTLDGITSFSDSPTAAQTNEIRTFTNTITAAGRPGSNSITVTALLNPLAIPTGFTEAITNGNTIGIRYHAEAEAVSARASSISVATTGNNVGLVTLTSDTNGVDQDFINGGTVLGGHLIITGAAGSRTTANEFKIDRIVQAAGSNTRSLYVKRLDDVALSGTISSTGWVLARSGFTVSTTATITQNAAIGAEIDGAVSVSFAFTTTTTAPNPIFHATSLR